MEKFRFFVDPQWQRTGRHIPLMIPFWGNQYGDKAPFTRDLFNRFPFDTSLYCLVSDIREADMILMPYNHNSLRTKYPDLLAEGKRLGKESGKLLVIESAIDIEHPAEEGAIMLRYGGYRFLPDPQAIQMPPYADDLLAWSGKKEITVREKSGKPSVGFAGWGSLPLLQSIRTVTKELPDRTRALFDKRYGACKKGVFFRRQVLKVLQASNKVTCNFLIRSSYSGHAATAEKSLEELRAEFVENLEGSDYALDVRGDPNVSVRLFESLSLGRIPLILDTERHFPFSDVLDYDTFSVRVDFRDLKKTSDILAAFHASLTPQKFVAMQHAARDAYVNYFRLDGITKQLVRALRERLARRNPALS
ncbi:MAG TPA: exostosin family protein [Pyrinomonadaceae bacterium]|jgi:hypothetical protein|nr:exostosin family protein [Pyrinomonadaceae bacterium]